MTDGRLDVGRLDAVRAEAGNIEKAERLKAGDMLIQGLSKRVQEQKRVLEEEVREQQEMQEETSEDRKVKGESKDVLRLSEQRKYVDICRDWVLEMEGELWEAFLNWFPSESKSLSELLEQLSRLYMQLLESIFAHTEGGEQRQEQIERLTVLLSEKLNLLAECSVKDLLEFAEEFGNQEDVANIRASLYRNVTKETLSGREAKAFFEKGEGPAKSEGSVLYAHLGKGEVQVSKSYSASVNESRAVLSERKEAGSVEVSFGKTGGLSTGKELETANRFVRYIRGNGNLPEPGGTEMTTLRLGAQEEGIRGVLAAAMDMKAEVFYNSAKASSVNLSSRGGERQAGGFFAEVRNMVGRMVDRYLTRVVNGQTADLNREADGAAGNGDRDRNVRDVYYYIMSIYRKTGNPEEALAAGIMYAMRQESWMACVRFVSRDWEEFLRVIGQQKGIDLARYMEKYSPWGALKEGEKLPFGKKGISKVLLFAVAGIIAGVLLFVLW